jgi:hypothetical protein
VSNDAEGVLPGEDLVRQGLADLAQNQLTELGLLVLIAAPRLRQLGIAVPAALSSKPFEHQLYDVLNERLGTDAHSYYNSLIRRVVSYAHALEREQSAT